MPKAQQHREQAQSNEQLAKSMCDGDSHYDWAVTVSFYAALHYLEAYFVRKGINILQEAEAKDTGAHGYRRRKVKEKLLPDEARRYITLQQQSERARYFASGKEAPLPQIPAQYFGQVAAQQLFSELETFRDYLASHP